MMLVAIHLIASLNQMIVQMTVMEALATKMMKTIIIAIITMTTMMIMMKMRTMIATIIMMNLFQRKMKLNRLSF